MKSKRMSTRKYLSQVRAMEVRIRHKEIQLNELKEIATSGGAIRYDKDKVISTVRTDKLEAQVVKYVDLENEIRADIQRYLETKNRIIAEIHSMTDSRYMDVLFKRYVEGKDIFQIADEVGYSYDWTRHLFLEAIDEFEKNRKF